MIGKNWNSDWLWQNSQRKYPLMDNVSGEAGDFTLPDSFLLDMCVPLRRSTANGVVRLASIAAFASGWICTISMGATPIGVFSVPVSGHGWGAVYPIFKIEHEEVEGEDALPSMLAQGSVVIGDLTEILLQPSGLWEFASGAAVLQPRCVIPAVGGVTGIRVKSGGAYSRLLSDEVLLEPGFNTRFRVDEETNTIYVDAIGNDDFLADCVCSGSRQVGDPIRTINGLPPNTNGDFTLQPGRTCLQIDALTNGLLLKDTCSTPCCGCAELDIINSALQTVRDQYASLLGMAQRLETTSQNLQNVVLASPLNVTP